MTSSVRPLRIIIFTLGSAGDVHPFIGIGTALVKRGHEVILATSPVFETDLLTRGMGFRPLGSREDFDRVKNDPDLWHPRRAFPAVVRHAVNPSHPTIFEITRELHVPGKTVVVASSLAFAARTACEVLGIPLATVHLAPSLFPSVHRQPEIHGMPFGNRAPRFLKSLQWSIAAAIVDHHALPALNRFRSELRLPPAKGLLRQWWHSPDRVIALFPEWFAPPQPDWPSQTVQTGFPLFDETNEGSASSEVEAFLSAGPPPISITAGSAMVQGHSFFREAAAAVSQLGRRAVFLTRDASQLPATLPEGCAHFPYVPFSALLHRSAAIIHHGGVGTCAQALQAGVPQLIQPMAHDQLDTLSRVRDLGVGIGLHPNQFTRHPIAAALERLEEHVSFTKNARRVSQGFQPDVWMTKTCESIESLASRTHGSATDDPSSS